MPEDRAQNVAERLIDTYGTLQLIASTDAEMMSRNVGISIDTALMVKLLGYIHSRSVTDNFAFGKVYNESDIKKYLMALFTGLHVEATCCISLDKRGRVLAVDRLNKGIVNASEISARAILDFACKNGASAIILAHNHPKGTAKASHQDVSATSTLQSILKACNVDLIAHYLVSETECKSISEQLDEL